MQVTTSILMHLGGTKVTETDDSHLSSCFLFSLAINSAISSLAAFSLLRIPLYAVKSRFTLSVFTFMLLTRVSKALGSLAPAIEAVESNQKRQLCIGVLRTTYSNMPLTNHGESELCWASLSVQSGPE